MKQESAYIILACDKPESYNLVQNKKIKKVVDIAKKIWYINEATCKKKASEVISEN